ASSMFFTLYDGTIFTAPLIFSQNHEAVRPISLFDSFFDSFNSISGNQQDANNIMEVTISQDGFHPKKIVVDKGQEILWRNDRTSLSALVVGVREISSMNSGFLESSDTFTWTFTESGEYTYVDAVVIGTIGTIVVQ
ncbi:hypothetical protein HOH30_00945, partial [Candidatus Woesearchaeota archaeon]|nr:hypothetical protein [Candidatus Woesearchaeota archaeon]